MRKIEKVLIADDHSLILDGFEKAVLGANPNLVIFKAKNLNELNEVLETHQIDVLFQDVRFGKDDARNFIKALKENYPELKILVISTFTDQTTVETLLKQGADGYISKTDNTEELTLAMNSLASGKTFLSFNIKADSIIKAHVKRIFLTSREREVLSSIIDGLTTQEIADKIHLSKKTIEIHRSNLLIKFDAKNVATLVKKAIFEGYM